MYAPCSCSPPLASALLAALLCFGACGPSYDTGRATADTWLATVRGTPQHKVEGQWFGPSRGYGMLGQQPFGAISLAQNGGQLVGHMPDYELVGSINGTTVSMVGLHDDKVYYTFHLELRSRFKPRLLSGKMCSGYRPQAEGDCHSIQFREHRRR